MPPRKIRGHSYTAYTAMYCSNTVQLSMQLAQLQADIISHRSLTHQFEAVP